MSLGEKISSGSATTKLLLHLNGNSVDSSGNGNVPSINTLVSSTGFLGGGYSTSGTASRYMRYASALGTTETGAKTISIWVKLLIDFSGANKEDRFTMIFYDASNIGFAIGYRRVSNVNTIYCSFDKNGNTTDYGNYAISLGTTNFHNLTLTVASSSRVLKLYLDGNYVATVTGATGSGESQVTDQYRLLHWNNVLDCIFDEVIVENVAWSASEIKKYYTYSKGRFGII